MERQWLLRKILENINIINDAVYNTIIDCDIRNFGDLYNINRFIQIINNHPRNVRSTNYKTNISNEKAKQYVKKFLEYINLNYKGKFEEIEKNIIFTKRIDVMEEAIFVAKNKIIHIPSTYTIADIYDITHEFTHLLSIKDEKMNDTLFLFCEVPSILSEFILEDYLLLKKQIGEYKIEGIRKYDGVYVNNCIIDVEIQLIETFMKYGGIYKEDLEQIFKNYSIDDLNFIKNYLFYIIEKYNELDISFSVRYSIGYVIATYIYDRINIYNYGEFIELIEKMNDYEIEEFLSYLDLELENVNYLRLTEKTYEKLEKSYVKMIKRFG